MENRFKRLRYYDDLCLHRKYTMDQLLKELQIPISKATISHLELSDDYDARVSIIKEYKKAFPEVSYDFLLGAKNTMYNEYSDLEQTLPLGDHFYETLKNLFRYDVDYDNDDLTPEMKQAIIDFESEMHNNIEYMLESIFSDSNRLSHFLSDTYKSLFALYLLEHPIKGQRESHNTKEFLSHEWFNLTQDIMNFFKEAVYENMQPVFEAEREAAIKRHQEFESYKETQQQSLHPKTDNSGLPFH